MVYLPSSGYRTHISLRRFFDHWQVGRAFRRFAHKAEKPDLILCAYPTIDLAYETLRFGTAEDIPTIIDVRDMWPDALIERITDRVPGLPEMFTRWLVAPYTRRGRRALAGATAIMAITSSMLRWAQDLGGRDASVREKDFHLYQSKLLPTAGSAEQIDHPSADLLMQRPDKIRLVWVGNIVPDTDANTLIEAIGNLSAEAQSRLDFIVCGRGSLAPQMQSLATKLDCVHYFEWLDATALHHLLHHSHYGLLCYLDRPDFHMSVPNKVVDYLAASLRIVSSIGGEIETLVADPDILRRYTAGDVRELTAIFENIAASPREQHAPSGKAFDLFQRHFDAEQNIETLEQKLLQIAEFRERPAS